MLIYNPTTLSLLSSTALFAGILSAIGGTSGIIILPALLMAGISPHQALGTNKLYTTACLFTSSVQYIKKRLFDPRYWIATSIATLTGAITGSILTKLISTSILQKSLPIVISCMAIYLLFTNACRAKFKKSARPEATKTSSTKHLVSQKILLPVGSLLGVYSGLFGAGTGVFWTTILTKSFKMDVLEASAVSRFMCFFSNCTALVTFIALGQINTFLGLYLGALGILGSYLGSHMTIRYGHKIVPLFTTTTTLLIAAKLLAKTYF